MLFNLIISYYLSLFKYLFFKINNKVFYIISIIRDLLI